MKMKQFLSAAASLTLSISMLGAPLAEVCAEGYPFRTTCDYYYEQFTSSAQKLYDDLLAVSKMIDESEDTYQKSPLVYYTGISSNELMDTMRMFSFDHPEFFWISNRYTYGYYGGLSYVQLVIYPEYQDGAERQKAKAQIIEAEQDYIDGAMKYATDYERAEYLSNRLYHSVEYGSVGDYLDQSLASVFLYEKTVCAGYTKAYSLLANAVGVDTVALRSPVHAWNATKIDDTWYVDDITNMLFLYSDAEIARYDVWLGPQELTGPDGQVKTSLMHELDYAYYTDIFPDTSQEYDGRFKVLADDTDTLEADSRTFYFMADDTNPISPLSLVRSVKLNDTKLDELSLNRLTLADGWETPAEILANHAEGKPYFHGELPAAIDGKTVMIGDVWIVRRGDMTMDGVVNANDATAILISAASVGTGNGPVIPKGMDENAALFAGKYVSGGSPYPTANDATAVLIYAAKVGTGTVS